MELIFLGTSSGTVEEKLQGLENEITFPPPVFDSEQGIIKNKFPVLKKYLYPLLQNM